VELRSVPVHVIPDEGPQPGDAHVSDEVANGPRELTPLPTRTASKQIAGTAKATGPTTIQVGDVQVRLFGIKPAGPADRCGLAGASDCLAAAQRALTARLPPGARIYCQTPLTHPGQAVAICLDPNGGDLGGYLVSEGLALADTGQSYDYSGAESIARNAKRGLWGGR
jgi:endonuclease YncB( thermonuclease family)